MLLMRTVSDHTWELLNYSTCT